MTSKFKNILDAARSHTEAETSSPNSKQTPVSATDKAPEPSSTRRRGRPTGGKRSDPDYEQVTAYIRKDVYRHVKIALLQEGEKTEFSQLVDRLLADWLRTKG